MNINYWLDLLKTLIPLITSLPKKSIPYILTAILGQPWTLVDLNVTSII
jgi:hypothetical protein